ncbi:MAG: 3-phosphoglycerate dehydrogenase, partial [Porticoccaceae bacterium]|nr:3-phosphoglycerate dehydrogenase [Porticoccaceae bacterium]
MYKVRTYNQISARGLDRFPRDSYEIASEFAAPDAFMLRSQKLHDMEVPESVLAAARCGAGVNNIPVDRFSEQGIVVFNTPGANANAVKELVIAGMLLASRDIVGGMNYSQ